jgi:enoyl-CoA hydratase
MPVDAPPPASRIRRETPVPGVARLVLDRPEVANATDKAMLYALNDAFDWAAQDDNIRVIILAAEGKHFSSGHDLRDRAPMGDFTPVSCASGFDRPGAEGWMAVEEELYLGLCWRWRNIPKPTIAEVQGKVILGALMLVWICDLVVASDDAEFSDPAVAFGMNGHELFVHPWEVGPRKAKEMLFTGDPISAHEAHQLGMVNHVVPRAELADHTEKLAARIAASPSMGLKLAKESVNQALEAQGQWTAIRAAFGLHQLGHSHNMQVHGRAVDPAGMQIIKNRNSTAPK